MSKQRIRIKTVNDEKGGSFVVVADADTSEPLSDISSIVVRIERDNALVAEVRCGVVTQQYYVENVNATISGEAVDNGNQ